MEYNDQYSMLMLWLECLFPFLLVLDGWTDPDKPQYRVVKEIPWYDDEIEHGKDAKLNDCSLKLKLFRLAVVPNRTDCVVTNDHKQVKTSGDATKACRADGRSNSTTAK